MTDIEKFSDPAMFKAAPMEASRTDQGYVVPTVTLVNITHDPLGANAAFARMYRGIPTTRLGEITDDERREYWDAVMATHLKAPFENIKLHLYLTGVTRGFTHQLVRQRTAVYAQESTRFAVKPNMADEVAYPPSIVSRGKESFAAIKYREAIQAAEEGYLALINDGVPAEDARFLLPHAVTTREHWTTDLRNLAGHMGNRLCTQAQFEWRAVAMGIVNAVRTYEPDFSFIGGERYREIAGEDWEEAYRWQFEHIADSKLFRPICYQTGKCEFKSTIDRACKIRTRVDAFAEHGVDSYHWGGDPTFDREVMLPNGEALDGIDPADWLLDPSAAIMDSRGGMD